MSLSSGGLRSGGLRLRNQQRNRDRIYDAALDLFTERPYSEVTVEEICARAEIGRATFFRFFGTKAGLLDEFTRRLIERVEQRLDASPGQSATERLWAVQDEIATAWGLSSPATREMAREWIRNATAAELSERGATPELVELVADVVREGQRTGEFNDRHDARFVGWVIVGSLSAATASWLGTGDEKDLVHGTHDAVAFLLDGLRRADQ